MIQWVDRAARLNWRPRLFETVSWEALPRVRSRCDKPLALLAMNRRTSTPGNGKCGSIFSAPPAKASPAGKQDTRPLYSAQHCPTPMHTNPCHEWTLPRLEDLAQGTGAASGRVRCVAQAALAAAGRWPNEERCRDCPCLWSSPT